MNNIFKFATNELSQEAFICWCANWINNRNENRILYKMGMDFMNLLAEGVGIKSVDIYNEINGINILIIVNESMAIIVENNISISENDDKLNRYKNCIEKEVELNIDKENIKCAYLENGELESLEEKVAYRKDIKLITRSDMIQLTKKYAAYSDVVKYYYEYLKELES